MKYESRQMYKVLGQCKPEDVLVHTGPDAPNKMFFGHLVKMTSLRYQTFVGSTRCTCCGIEGTVMLLEMPTNCGKICIPHFNLYAKHEGQLIQMTKDHKTPKSKGGKNHVHNMQTMCHVCNELKGSSKRKIKDLRKIRDGSQTIYTIWDFAGYPMSGFATSQKGIAEIIRRYIINTRGWSENYFEGKFEILVDMQKMCVILEEEDGSQQSYHIHKIERV